MIFVIYTARCRKADDGVVAVCVSVFMGLSVRKIPQGTVDAFYVQEVIIFVLVI